MKSILLLSISLCLLLSICCKPKTTIPPTIAVETFFKNPEKVYFRLSPSGKYLSFTKPWESRMNIFVQKIGDDSLQQITFEKDRGINEYFWATDDCIIYLKDEGGNEDFKLYRANINESKPVCLTCFENVLTEVIDELKDDPDNIIIGLNKRNPEVFDPYRLNINTGEMQLLAENPGNIVSWITDHDGKLRAATAVSEGVNLTLLYRDTELEKFHEVITTSWRDNFYPLFFTFDNKNLYASSNLGRDKNEIVIFDIQKGEETESLFKNDEVDVEELTFSRKLKKLSYAGYTTDKKQYYFFDEETKNIFNHIQQQLPGKEIVITCWNKNEDIFIVRTFSDRSEGSYYLYTLVDKKLEKIADVSPWLKEEQMASMQPVTYTSRDGLTIHGYLTLPLGRKPKNLPVVIFPHGGPWYRDTWGFNTEAQFFSNRGYAVLQMNFRGSTGYGREFWLKSVKQWGHNMQNDITDGVNWLIDQRIADKRRIAIYGGSYGGYAVLAGLAFTPDVYACGIDYVGVSNMFTFMNTIPSYWEPQRQMLYELVGNPKDDSLLLAEVSPVLHSDKITSPLFIAQGANDPRVNKAESDQMVEALKARGVTVEYMVKDNEGHGFYNEENQFDLYRAMEKFLALHIGDSVVIKK